MNDERVIQNIPSFPTRIIASEELATLKFQDKISSVDIRGAPWTLWSVVDLCGDSEEKWKLTLTGPRGK